MKNLYWLVSRWLCILSAACFSENLAFAQNIEEYISVSPPQTWVEVQDVPQENFNLADDLKATYRLISKQNKISRVNRESYQRFVIGLNTPAAVEENGTVSVSFDPSYKKVIFHHIK